MSSKLNIVILERDSVGIDVDVDRFACLGELVVYGNTVENNVRERIRNADIIIANKAPLNRDTLKEADKVKLICEFATGYDNVDIDYCREMGIIVSNVANYSTEAVTQHTFALCFYIWEKLHYYDHYVKSGLYANQERFSHFGNPFYEISGKIWGIVGMGNIGRSVAKVAEAFGCRVIFYSTSGNSTCTAYQRVDFDTLLMESDIISIHCPLTEKTKGIFDIDAFKKMKKSAILINVARGPVVNDDALYQAITEGMIEGAGVDVTGTEPMKDTNPLSKISDSNKLVITPHMAWASKEARNRLADETYLNIESFLNGDVRSCVYANSR